MRINADEFVRQDEYFFRKTQILQEYWKKVNIQARNHTRRVEDNLLSRRNRPNESDIIKEYRQSNKRYLTAEGVSMFLSRFTRVVGTSGVTLIESSVSDKLRDYLGSAPYLDFGQNLDWKDFAMFHVLSFALEDPNGLIVEFPYMETSPDTPPASSDSIRRETISIETLFIPSEDRIDVPNGMFCWRGGEMEVVGKSELKAGFFWIVDSRFFYRYIPVWDKSKIRYVLQEWYYHDCGFNDTKCAPVTVMPGYLAATVEDSGKKYKESFLRSYFEYADEFEVRFQDNQAVWVRTAYPKAVVRPMPCSNSECRGGDVIVYDDEGRKVDLKKCDTCGGKGVISDISPYNTLIRADNNGFNKDPSGPVLEYISPNPQILDINFSIPFDLLKKGMNSIGLNTIGSTAESGEAKKMRLQVLEDKLSSVSFALFKGVIESHLSNLECLLVVSRGSRKKPVISLPESYKIKDVDTLTEEVLQATPADRMLSELRLIERKYAGSPEIIKAYEFAFAYSPLLVMTTKEVEFRMAAGVGYTPRDIIKRDNAVSIFLNLSKTGGFLTWDLDRAIKEADKLIDIIYVEPNIIDESNTIEEA